MPCSPVTVPPMSIATSMISANAACDRFIAASSPRGVISSGCRLPSPAWAAFAMKVSWPSGDLLDPHQHLGQSAAGQADVLDQDRVAALL